MKKANGSCLCQAVTVEVEEPSTDMGACHCSTCRKWAGGPYLALDCGVGKLTIRGEKNITRYNSSDWAERGFCSACGTHLFYRLKEKNQYMMPVGLFDLGTDENQIKFDHQIFVEENPPYYNFANETKKMTGEEVFAEFQKS